MIPVCRMHIPRALQYIILQKLCIGQNDRHSTIRNWVKFLI